jgi:Polyketide cyclase / dehydrase and lipid transport
MTPATVAPVLLIAALMVLVLLAAGILFSTAGRLDLRRSIIVHVPAAEAWRLVRHFPTLHARHGKVRLLGAIDDWALQRGDGEGAGSVWRARGRWGEAPYWATIEIVRSRPGCEIAIALRGDSLGTHRGLREHFGSLTLEEMTPGSTKLTWCLRARLRGARLRAERLVALPRLQARLFDQGLRSIKLSLESAFERSATAVLLQDPDAAKHPAGPESGRTGPGASPPPPPRPPDSTT